MSVLDDIVADQIRTDLPELAAETKADLAAMLPSYAPAPTNPLDITAGLSEEALFQPLERLSQDPSVDLVLNVVTLIGGSGRLKERAEGLVAAQERIAKPIVSCWTAGSLADDGLRDRLGRAGRRAAGPAGDAGPPGA